MRVPLTTGRPLQTAGSMTMWLSIHRTCRNRMRMASAWKPGSAVKLDWHRNCHEEQRRFWSSGHCHRPHQQSKINYRKSSIRPLHFDVRRSMFDLQPLPPAPSSASPSPIRRRCWRLCTGENICYLLPDAFGIPTQATLAPVLGRAHHQKRPIQATLHLAAELNGGEKAKHHCKWSF